MIPPRAPAGGRRRVLLLRAVNVGGAKLPMALLRQIAVDLGATEVSTYIASGNLICDVPGDPIAFDRLLEAAVEERCGFFREVISRSPSELAAALDTHPFAVVEPRFSHITFLLHEPEAARIEQARTHPVGGDQWAVLGREMHIRYADGSGRPQMKEAAISRAIGVPGTARNLNTVRTLIELAR